MDNGVIFDRRRMVNAVGDMFIRKIIACLHSLADSLHAWWPLHNGRLSIEGH